jgi:hypothetical protein
MARVESIEAQRQRPFDQSLLENVKQLSDIGETIDPLHPLDFEQLEQEHVQGLDLSIEVISFNFQPRRRYASNVISMQLTKI